MRGIKYMRKALILLYVLLLSTLSCLTKPSYEEVVAEELAKGNRFDEVILDIHLGMTYDDFYKYCFFKKQEGVVKPNVSGTGVVTVLTEGFSNPVEFSFYPERSKLFTKKITKIEGKLMYQNFSLYNRDLRIEKLLAETITSFENKYKGNKFFTAPHPNKIMKYIYLKIDGNRKIMVRPTFDGSHLIIKIEDLKPKID